MRFATLDSTRFDPRSEPDPLRDTSENGRLERTLVRNPASFHLCAVALMASWAHAAGPYVDNELRIWGSGAGFLTKSAKAFSMANTGIALHADGTVTSWGGAGTAPTSLTTAVAVSAGAYFGLALKSDSTVVAWPVNGSSYSTVPSTLKSVTAIAAGANFAVALKSNGTVVGWGDDFYGPVTIPRGLGVLTAIAAGDNHVLALKADSTVVGWGRNDNDQVTMPAGAGKGVAVAGGGLASAVIRADSMAIFWGGPDKTLDSLKGVRKAIPGYDHFLFLMTNGKVVRWKKPSGPTGGTNKLTVIDSSGRILDIGNNGVDYGLKSDGSIVAFDGSFLPLPLDSVVALSANTQDNGIPFAVALKKDSTLHVAWTSSDAFSIPKGLKSVKGFAIGNGHGLALKRDSTVVAWGNNSENQTTVPAWVTGVKAVAAAGDFSLALLSDSTVVGWGNNTFGQRSTSSITGAMAIAAGTYHGVALLADSTVTAWGRNDHGESTVPAGLSKVVAISAGNWHTLALKADGTVVAWGVDWEGQCKVPAGLKNVVAISAGAKHSVALKSDGTVVAWGDNTNGQSTVPAGLTGVTAIAAGVNFTIVRVAKSNGPTEARRFGHSGTSLSRGSYPIEIRGLDGSLAWAGKATWNGSSWEMGFQRRGTWLVRVAAGGALRTQRLVLLK